MDRDSAFFYLTNLKSIAWGETYLVRVQAKVDNAWGKWGAWCWFRAHTQKTTLDSNICGLQDVNSTTKIAAIPVPGAERYWFEVKQGGQVEKLLVGDSASFNFQDLKKPPVWGSVYQIRLQAKVNGSWGKWSNWCAVRTSEQKTELDSLSCELQDINLDTLLKAYPVSYATKYQFEVKQGKTSELLKKDSAYFIFKELKNQPVWGATYLVRVQAKVDNAWGKWGKWCKIYTFDPQTTLDSLSCDQKGVTPQTILSAIPFSQATHYEFELKEGGTTLGTLVKDTTAFQVSELVDELMYTHSYTIRVRMKINDAWTNYGNICQIYPKAYYTGLQWHQCEDTVGYEDELTIYEVPEADSYIWLIETVGNYKVREVKTQQAKLKLQDTKLKLHPDSTYKIKIRVFIQGQKYPYGKSCAIYLKPYQTQITNLDCQRVDLKPTDIIQINPVQKAEQYEIRFVRANKQDTVFIRRNSPSFRWSLLGTKRYGKFDVGIRIKIHGIWHPWGTSCKLESVVPPTPTGKTKYHYCTDVAYPILESQSNFGDVYWYADTTQTPIYKGTQFVSPYRTQKQAYYVTTHSGGLFSPYKRIELTYGGVPSDILITGQTQVHEGTTPIWKIQVASSSNYQYEWTGGALSSPHQKQTYQFPPVKISDSGTYQISITDKVSKCTYIYTKRLKVLPVVEVPVISVETALRDSVYIHPYDVLDEITYKTSLDGKLYLIPSQVYQLIPTYCQVYSTDAHLVGVARLATSSEGSYYILNLNPICTPNTYYYAKVVDAMGEKYEFRFLYRKERPLEIQLYAASPCANNPVEFSLMLQGGEVPYQIEVFTAINDTLTTAWQTPQVTQSLTREGEFVFRETMGLPENTTYYTKVRVTDSQGLRWETTQQIHSQSCNTTETETTEAEENPLLFNPQLLTPWIKLQTEIPQNSVPITPSSMIEEKKSGVH